MENLQLILVTVLITLVSVAVVGSIAYLVAVVRKLKHVVNNHNTVDITNLQQTLHNEVTELHNRINNSNNEFNDRFREFDSSISNMYSELYRKLDSRCDKLYDGYNKEIQQVYQEFHKRDEEFSRQSLGLKK